MFTGIIDHCGEIIDVKRNENACQIWVRSQFTDLQLGESIAVNGGCLTVADLREKLFRCDLSPETLSVTVAQYYHPQTKVNLERSLRLMDRIGGHFVSGHVDQVASLKSKMPEGEFVEIEFSNILPENINLLIPKGSITVNGISLTINEITENGFEVMIIPHTAERTNILALQVADKVNIEFDLLSKIVVNQLQRLEIIAEEKIYE